MPEKSEFSFEPLGKNRRKALAGLTAQMFEYAEDNLRVVGDLPPTLVLFGAQELVRLQHFFGFSNDRALAQARRVCSKTDKSVAFAALALIAQLPLDDGDAMDAVVVYSQRKGDADSLFSAQELRRKRGKLSVVGEPAPLGVAEDLFTAEE